MLPSLTAARQDGGVCPFWKRRVPRKDTESHGGKVDGIGTSRRFSFTFTFTFTNFPDRERARERERVRVREDLGGLFLFTFAGLRNAHVV